MESSHPIAGYTLLERLGEGSQGVVWRALQTGLGREVALKVFRARAVAAAPEVELRFRREVDISTRLAHPGIARVYDAGIFDGALYYAMELVRGSDMQSVRNREGPLPPAQVADLLRQLLEALRYFHGCGLVHRDIKPGNVMREAGTGRLVLTDLGLVRMTEATIITAPGQVLGSPRYMAPEQLGGAVCTAASDLWSLGVTAYTLLAPRPAFDGRNLTELSQAILRANPPHLSTLRADAPEWLCERIMHLIAAAPTARIILPEPAVEAAPEAFPVAVAAAPPPRARAYAVLAALSVLGLGLHVGLEHRRVPASAAVRFPAAQLPGEQAALRLLGTLSTHDWSGAVGDKLWRRLGIEIYGSDRRTTGSLREIAIEQPGVGVRIDTVIGALAAGAVESFTSLEPHLEALLSNDRTAPALRDRLLDAIWKLDQVDAVAEYLSRPAPFSVRRALAPTIEHSCAPDSVSRPQPGRAGRQLYPGEAEPRGRLIFVDREDPRRGGDLFREIGETVIDLHEAGYLGTWKSDSLELPDLNPGSDGFTLNILLTSYAEQSAIRLTDGTRELDLRLRRPIRPRVQVDIDRPVWVTLTVRGALARPVRRLTLRHERAFEDSGRIILWIREVWFAPLALGPRTAGSLVDGDPQP